MKEEYVWFQFIWIQDATLAEMLLRPGPVQALVTAKFPLAEKDEDEVPRIYIKTTQDNVIKAEQQEAMISKWPPQHVYVLESDHSPFFSAPFLLFGLLVKAAVSFGYWFMQPQLRHMFITTTIFIF